ncbi:Eukaryotic translation initiation factor 3 subunit L [Porphyridium purpureum]|uniref:Eukaryotic translation initiation factor 3 subunit L n=1 Tax=Porphyridium purpureum TaxID=35688 RepID=A0A5J4Z4C3_PORPP|nr:Eukaryotic translation initiation factor 3 subunit L [Porphyridium purpureum]|eukprot:POR8345..scf295_1
MDSMNWRSRAEPVGVPAVDDSAAIERNPELGNVPDAVRQFIVFFRAKFREGNTQEIHTLYENTFNKLSKKYYPDSEWPPAEVIAPLVENDEPFLLLYKELYFRHVHGTPLVSLAHRLDAWQNYGDLFDFFLTGGMRQFDLPPSWLWDLTDEFIYQFEAWCQYRSKPKNKTEEEIQYLEENDYIWNVNGVLGYLHNLVHHSNIISWLLNGNAPAGSSDPRDNNFDVSSLPVYRYIGYFSIIGLLRLHCLLQDYRLALLVLQPLDFDITTPLYTHVSACNVSLFYYMGFAYMMLRRYDDAIRVFSSTLMHIGRIKQYHTRSYQFEQINKRNDQMVALLSICFAFSPQHTEESKFGILREKYSDKLNRMLGGDESVFEELFTYASPKFVSPAPPDYQLQLIASAESSASIGPDPAKLQLAIFMREVKQQALLPHIRSYLRLYRSINVPKLASFMDVDDATCRANLLSLKHKSWELVGNAFEPPVAGTFQSRSGVHFHINSDNVVQIQDSEVEIKYGHYFIEQMEHLDAVVATQRLKLLASASKKAVHE